jgi:hypothetical protein
MLADRPAGEARAGAITAHPAARGRIGYGVRVAANEQDDATETAPPSVKKASRSRRIAARVLVVLGAITAAIALLAGYLHYQVGDEATFRGTVQTMIADPVIRDQIATSLVDGLYDEGAVSDAIETALPPKLKPLAGPIAGAAEPAVDRAASRLLSRPAAQRLWVSSVTRARTGLLHLLDNDTTTLRTEGGYLVLNLQPLTVQLGDKVAIAGAVTNRLPDEGVIRIVQVDRLSRAQQVTSIFRTVAPWFWIVPLLLWAAAIALARGYRRVELRAVSLAIIAAGLLVLVLRHVAGRYIIGAVVAEPSVRPAAEQAWSILTSLLADGAWTAIGLGVVALVGAWLAGPGPRAITIRRRLAPRLANPGLTYGVAFALLLLVVWWGPTAQTRRLLWIVVVSGLLALGVEALRRVAAADPDAGVPGAPLPLAGAMRSRSEDRRLASLERLQSLRASGGLTEAEYEQEKARLLDGG